MTDLSKDIQAQVQAAYENETALHIQGGNTKAFYGCKVEGETLSLAEHKGVISYEPTELVIRARAGTPLAEIERLLDEENQMLAFEPPYFGEAATVGGMLAAGLSGPRRAYSGAVRDHVLGASIINGKAEHLAFGGQVMKNVAGYDVSRLLAGSLGTLGVIMDVSLKVIPKPEQENTVYIEVDKESVIEQIQTWYLQALPLSASTYFENKLYLRLSGLSSTVEQAIKTISQGENCDNSIWQDIKEHKIGLLKDKQNLYRFSVPAHTSLEKIHADVIEWGGALRWLNTDKSFPTLQEQAKAVGGSVSRFYVSNDAEYFQALPKGVETIHKNLKQAFDPKRILNPARMYSWM